MAQISYIPVFSVHPAGRGTPETRSPHGERLARMENTIAELGAELHAMKQEQEARGVSLLAFSDDLDRLLALLTIANGAAMIGKKVNLFFSFWATALLRRPDAKPATLMDRVLGWFMRRPGSAKLSRMNFCGAGTALMKRRMSDAQIASLEDQLEMAASLGVKIGVCDTSLALLGIREQDLIDYPGLQVCGVASFMDTAIASQVTMMI